MKHYELHIIPIEQRGKLTLGNITAKSTSSSYRLYLKSPSSTVQKRKKIKFLKLILIKLSLLTSIFIH